MAHPLSSFSRFVMRNPKNTNEFHITERYTDKAAIAYHASTDLYKVREAPVAHLFGQLLS